jgi:hypothetical protein
MVEQSNDTKQLKISVDTELANAFKRACVEANTTMVDELAAFMSSYLTSPHAFRQGEMSDDPINKKHRYIPVLGCY